jgi:hypothetical protein
MECNVQDEDADDCSTLSDECRFGKVQRIMNPHSEHPGVEPDQHQTGIVT